MTIQKCPRCDLNYIKDGEEYCKVCARELKKEKTEEFLIREICFECGEHLALSGSDMCGACLLEKKLIASQRKEADSKSDIEAEDDRDIELIGGGDDESEDETDEEMDGFIIKELYEEFFDLGEEDEDFEGEKNAEKQLAL